MTKREKRLRDLRRTIASWETRREAAIRTLVRSETQLPALRKRAERLAVLLLKAGTPVEEPEAPRTMTYEIRPQDGNGGIDRQVITVPVPDDRDLPTFLDRTRMDEEARAEIRAEQAADKKRKADLAAEKRAIKKEVLQAELTGQRRKLPLTGKEALAAIRAGR